MLHYTWTYEEFYYTRSISSDPYYLSCRLHAEDLAFLLGMQQKDLRKLCAKLREDRLISVYGWPAVPRYAGQ